MSDLKDKKEKSEKKVVIEKPAEKRYTITNALNATVEFYLGRQFFRLSPRGQVGDSVEMSEELANHSDMVVVNNKIVRELKK